MPTLAPTATSWPPMRTGRCELRRAAAPPPGPPRRRPSTSSSRTANSSPPRRAAVSSARSSVRSRPASAISSSSPCAWPSRSLTSLKSSTSTNSTATSLPGASSGRARGRAARGTARGSPRPVSGSWSARCTASAWLRALVSASDACSANARRTSRSDSAYGRPSARAGHLQGAALRLFGVQRRRQHRRAVGRRPGPRREPAVEAHAGAPRRPAGRLRRERSRLSVSGRSSQSTTDRWTSVSRSSSASRSRWSSSTASVRSESDSTRPIARSSDISSRVNSSPGSRATSSTLAAVHRGGEDLARADARARRARRRGGDRCERGVRHRVAREAGRSECDVAGDHRAGLGAERVGGTLDGALAGGGHVLRRRDRGDELRELRRRPAGAGGGHAQPTASTTSVLLWKPLTPRVRAISPYV